MVDKIPVTIIEGRRGSGKTSIINQLILNSSFYSAKVSIEPPQTSRIAEPAPFQTSDTIDSGCVPDGATTWNSANYEWMRAVATRLVAFHICDIQSVSGSSPIAFDSESCSMLPFQSSSCSIPEFVCNIGAWLCRSPILKSYADILNKVGFLTEFQFMAHHVSERYEPC